jgi:hypothetical protein
VGTYKDDHPMMGMWGNKQEPYAANPSQSFNFTGKSNLKSHWKVLSTELLVGLWHCFVLVSFHRIAVTTRWCGSEARQPTGRDVGNLRNLKEVTQSRSSPPVPEPVPSLTSSKSLSLSKFPVQNTE